MAGMKKRKHGVSKIEEALKGITESNHGLISFELGPMEHGFFATDNSVKPVGWCRSDLPPGLSKRARKLDIAAAALAQRDRLAAEVEALLLIVKALEAENRRAWAMVRKLESQ